MLSRKYTGHPPGRWVRSIRLRRRLKPYNFRCWSEVFACWVCWEELLFGFDRADSSRPIKTYRYTDAWALPGTARKCSWAAS